MEKTRKIASSIGEVTLVTLVNAAGNSVEISTLGAGIVSIKVPDAEGKKADVVMGYKNPADYVADGPCCGKTPGRYANRIALGNLVVDGVRHQLSINNGPNALHGGPWGFANRIWTVEELTDNKVVLTYRAVDGEEHYPGNLDAKVTYTWSDADELTINYEAVTDKDTVINLTNHAYFNLAGHNSGTVLNHRLHILASKWLPTDATQIPTGEIADVKGTPMDFTEPKAIGRDIKEEFEALKIGKGYDHCWCLDDYDGKGTVVKAAELTSPDTTRRLEVFTDQPGLQVYTGNWLDGCPEGKDNAVYHDYDAVALECQGYPDAPNKPEFPSQLLRPGEKYQRTIIFKFINN